MLPAMRGRRVASEQHIVVILCLITGLAWNLDNVERIFVVHELFGDCVVVSLESFDVLRELCGEQRLIGERRGLAAGLEQGEQGEPVARSLHE